MHRHWTHTHRHCPTKKKKKWSEKKGAQRKRNGTKRNGRINIWWSDRLVVTSRTQSLGEFGIHTCVWVCVCVLSFLLYFFLSFFYLASIACGGWTRQLVGGGRHSSFVVAIVNQIDLRAISHFIPHLSDRFDHLIVYESESWCLCVCVWCVNDLCHSSLVDYRNIFVHLLLLLLLHCVTIFNSNIRTFGKLLSYHWFPLNQLRFNPFCMCLCVCLYVYSIWIPNCDSLVK